MVLQAGSGEEPAWTIPGWHALTTRYLRGELEPCSLWLRRVHEDGREEWLGSFGAGR